MNNLYPSSDKCSNYDVKTEIFCKRREKSNRLPIFIRGIHFLFVKSDLQNIKIACIMLEFNIRSYQNMLKRYLLILKSEENYDSSYCKSHIKHTCIFLKLNGKSDHKLQHVFLFYIQNSFCIWYSI